MKSGKRKAESESREAEGGNRKSEFEIRNGMLVDGEGAAAEPTGAAGVFETVLVHEGRGVFFDEHVRRFSDGCAHYIFGAAPSGNVLREAASELIGCSGIAEGVLRWAAWRDAEGGEGWGMRIGPPRPHMLLPAWRIAVSPVRLPAPGTDASFKRLQRRPWNDALAAGRAAGFDEVLLCDAAGGIIEGAVSNVFCVHRGGLVTPSLPIGPLPGIVRAKVIELAAEAGAPVAEAAVTIDDLGSATEIFLTNALVGIRPVALLDFKRLPAPGPVTLRLLEAWRRRHGWPE